MDRKEFIKKVTEAVSEYIDNFDRFDSNPQLRVDPETLEIAIVNGSEMQSAVEDSDEAIEDAAAAHGMANQETMDAQVGRNPDFYSLKRLLKPKGDTEIPNAEQIRSIASGYF